MAARKNKQVKVRKKPQAPGRKSRLWVRDTLNIVAGLLLGGLGVWLFQEYLESRETREVARRYLNVVHELQPQLKPLIEQYLELTEGKEDGVLPEVDLDTDRPVCSLNPFSGVLREACALPPETAAALLDLAQNLQRAEMLRKLLQQEAQDPGGLVRTLSNQLLQTVYDESRGLNNLIYQLRERAAREPPPEEAPAGPAGEDPNPSP